MNVRFKIEYEKGLGEMKPDRGFRVASFSGWNESQIARSVQEAQFLIRAYHRVGDAV